VNAPERILLIRLKSIGDILFTLPAVHRVRDNFPEARISFLVSKEHAPLLEGFRDVDEVLTLDRAPFHRKQIGAMCAETLRLVQRLRRGRFSLVVDFQGYGETALLTWLTRAPQRWGSVYRAGRRWAYTQGVARNDKIQIADWNLSLLEQCGLRRTPVRNEFCLPAHAAASAKKFFAENGLDPAKPTLFIQPFTSSAQKNWPLVKYLALAKYWRAAGVQVIFGGGPADGTALVPVRREDFVTSAGVPLLTSAALIELSALLVGGVTGLLHLAVAMNKRVVMLIGHAAREPGFPYQHRDWAVAADSLPVAAIPAESVIEATTKAFAELGVIHSALGV